MPSDTVICAAEVAPGKACGLDSGHPFHPSTSAYFPPVPDIDPTAEHEFIPGRQCQACGGNGERWTRANEDSAYVGVACPRCIGGVERVEEAVDE